MMRVESLAYVTASIRHLTFSGGRESCPTLTKTPTTAPAVSTPENETRLCGGFLMGGAGLEPATSWV
jgi:hypothetical protein